MADNLRTALEAAKQRADAATPGPWSLTRPEGDISGFKRGVAVAAAYGRQMIWADPPGGSFPANDARFIAAARAEHPALIEFALAVLAASTMPYYVDRHAALDAAIAKLASALGVQQ